MAPAPGASALLLDIEGTTTPIDFVYKTLFPFARDRARAFLESRWDDPAVAADVERLRAERAVESEPAPDWRDDADRVAAYVHWLMERDRKSTGLKALQGRIWQEGYRSGALRGEVYRDVPAALARWRRAGRDVAIFSSGSVLAQQLLFAHSSAGDLTPFLSGYFDTTTGPKTSPESYRRIAAELRRQPAQVLFVSDTPAELDAARAAGLQTRLCVRDPAAPLPAGAHAALRTLDEV